MSDCIEEEHEALLQFLYVVPIGLLQTGLDGSILMANPAAARLLMPLSREAELVNLFTALQGADPGLRLRVDGFDAPTGTVCKSLRLVVGTGGAALGHARQLSLTILKLEPTRLMVVLCDVTPATAAEAGRGAAP